MKIASLFSILLLLGACANLPLEKEAAAVRIYFSPFEKTGCEYKGEVVGSDGNMLTFWFISNTDLVQGALNDLRNDAHHLGGDTVFILREQLSFTTSTTFLGSVYRCSKQPPAQ